MTLAVAGSNGMLGREVVEAASAAGCTVVPLGGRAECDITDRHEVYSRLQSVQPDVLVNAAAMTDVDGAEEQYEVAEQLNGHGPGVLAEICRKINCTLIHFSTDYVFDGAGTKPYRTNDPVDPVNAYGRSKLAGERAIAATGGRYAVVRTSWLVAPHGSNFLRTILRLAAERESIQVVNDQVGRPTVCRDLAQMSVRLSQRIAVDSQWSGRILHAANDGHCSWYELAECIVDTAGLDCVVKPCGSDAFPRPARRPAYSVLDITELADLIGSPQHWRPAVEQTVRAALAAQTPQATTQPTRETRS